MNGYGEMIRAFGSFALDESWQLQKNLANRIDGYPLRVY
jgi:hypothetical protein